MEQVRTCKKCGDMYKLNKDNFGHQPNGSYRYTCRSCVRGAVRQAYRENPQASKDRTSLRKDTVFTVAEKKSVMLKLAHRDGWGCYYCKKDVDDYHVDHKIPVTKGGEHALSNFVLACMPCNQEKHNKTEDEYRTWLRLRGEKVSF